MKDNNFSNPIPLDNNMDSFNHNHKKLKNIILSIFLVFVIILIIVFVIIQHQKKKLKEDLTKTWYSSEGTILLVLDINENTIEYSTETGYSYLDTVLGNFEWEPINKNTIKVKQFSDDYDTFKIKFNDDKTSFTISPALTSTDENETWYDISYEEL